MCQPSSPNRSRSLSERVVRAVADHLEISPEELEEPLYDAIDPEALDGIFSRRSEANTILELEFRYHGQRVTVEKDGSITVRDQF